MNPIMKNVFMLFAIVLIASLSITTMSRAGHSIPRGLSTGRLISNETICEDVDPNVPEEFPEMVPESLWINVISEDSNDLPDSSPEMVLDSLWMNVIEDSNDLPEPSPEMVPFI